jgi:hydroxyacylglutathione hydrolase
MKIHIIPCLQDNYSYIIHDQSNNYACVIDPSEAEPIINFVKKNNLKLKYILNTHHHYDHVGGNERVKKEFGSKIIGFKGDKHRIPLIDIELEDQEIWTSNNFEAKIFHIPGHTSGHICFHFYKNNFLFTGDTLFSLGCGRIFEGTYNEMFNSLKVIKNLPEDTLIYCGHEYTKKNAEFCLKYDPNNNELIEKIAQIKKSISKGNPTIPSTLREEITCNIFLKAKDVEMFSKLRDLKDNF